MLKEFQISFPYSTLSPGITIFLSKTKDIDTKEISLKISHRNANIASINYTLNNGRNGAQNCKVLTFGCVLLTAPRLEFAFLNCINFMLSSEALLFYLPCVLCFESTVKIERQESRVGREAERERAKRL